RATTGVGKPQADSEGNERIPPDGFDMVKLHFTREPLHIPRGSSKKTLHPVGSHPFLERLMQSPAKT
ncbi:hypothetical protein, partial [Ruminococcus callidus]|uniref:hypothetical protein n=1 Tax=Ruminococcus callidus TaxID=40519 RepID=UPI0023F74331